MKNSQKKFLKRPEYPGGKEAFKAYIKSNLVYPEEARQQMTEGIVHLSAQIDDNGTVREVVIEKGIGGGCDEEAARLIKNVQFGTVKNRGLRLKTWKKFRIGFRLPPQTKVIYNMPKSHETSDPGSRITDINKAGRKYSYSITINSD